MSLVLSPACRRDDHDACVWFDVSADYKRTYWCECECHSAGAVIDLTSAPTPGRAGTEAEAPVSVADEERVLVPQQ